MQESKQRKISVRGKKATFEIKEKKQAMVEKSMMIDVFAELAKMLE